MARAKRTDRAVARRRNRATFVDPLADGDLAPNEGTSSSDESTPAPSRRAVANASAGRPSTPAAGAPPTRPSIAAAFRSSFRPLDLRGDIRALPQLLRHWSFLVPVILSGLAVALVPLLGLNAMTDAFFKYFSGQVPLGSAFLAGFFAPRASYLVGALVALASVGFMAIAFSVGPFGGILPTLDVNGQPLSADAARIAILIEALRVGVPFAALFAAMAAWYKRFLNRANPNRSRPRPGTTTGRRPDGKVAKKNERRPMLARRR